MSLEPFASAVRGLDELDAARAAMRAAGPVVVAEAPWGGPVWIVTDAALARAVLVDPRIVKDPACAPESWDPMTAGLEPTAAEQTSLTTLDGPAHARLRAAHNPLFTAARMRARAGGIAAIARDLLAGLAATDEPVDLAADFTTRYPLTVVLDLLGVPLDRVDRAAAACARVLTDDPAQQGAALGELAGIAGTALTGDGLAVELRAALADVTEAELQYLLFGLLFAGQVTTDPALGFVLARALGGESFADADAFVRDVLRRHPPAPYTLWRFTAEEVELAGTRLPARAPVLVDVLGINTGPARGDGPDLTFGAGPHYCLGAQLAQLELRIAVQVLRADFPQARLAVPFEELRHTALGGGIQGTRLTALPVLLR